MRACLAVFLMAVANLAMAQTVGEMLSRCRPIAEAKIVGEKISYTRSLDTEFCWGAFATARSFSSLADERGKPILRLCVPENTRQQQFVAVFVENAKKNPERWHENFHRLMFESLLQAFPCK